MQPALPFESVHTPRDGDLAGDSKVRVTEFQFKTADGVGWYRLNMEDYGPTGEWVFWTLKPRS